MNPDHRFARLPVPRVPLTDVQHEEFAALLAEAESLRAAGEHDRASRLVRLAANIARAGPPVPE